MSNENHIVYILTNLAMPGYIKIGRTTNLSQRLLSLDNTSLPLPFECFYASKVKDSYFVEKQLHRAFDDNRIRRNREFFKISPEQVVAALRLAEIEEITPIDEIVDSKDDYIALEKARTRRENFNFEKLDIKTGSLLTFTRNSDVTCTVSSENKVIFNETVQSLSSAAKEALKDEGKVWKAAQGPSFWKYEGKTIDEIRDL